MSIYKELQNNNRTEFRILTFLLAYANINISVVKKWLTTTNSYLVLQMLY